MGSQAGFKKANTEFHAQELVKLTGFTFCGQRHSVAGEKPNGFLTQIHPNAFGANPPGTLQIKTNLYAVRMKTVGPLQSSLCMPLVPLKTKSRFRKIAG